MKSVNLYTLRKNINYKMALTICEGNTTVFGGNTTVFGGGGGGIWRL